MYSAPKESRDTPRAMARVALGLDPPPILKPNYRRISDRSWRCKFGDDVTWVKCMQGLVTAVSQFQDLYVVLLDCLAREDLSLVKRRDGDKLLTHCFKMIPYQHIKALIMHVLNGSEDTHASCDCLRVCFDKAKAEEMVHFENFLLSRCTEMATGTCSNYFMQHALEYGTNDFKKRIVQRLMRDVMPLSSDKHGSHVVQSCFMVNKNGDVEVLCIVLTAFCDLTPRQLIDMVPGSLSKHVLQRLLDTGYMYLPELTKKLAQKMAMLAGDVLEQAEANLVRRSVRRVLDTRGH